MFLLFVVGGEGEGEEGLNHSLLYKTRNKGGKNGKEN